MAKAESHDVVPVTMLSGFLGAGESDQLLDVNARARLVAWMLQSTSSVGITTLLRHLLENTKLKIGCIVNDVATVNVDAKLIRNDRTRDRDQNNNTTSDLADTIELANGCACKPSERCEWAFESGSSSKFVCRSQAVVSQMNCSPPLISY